MKLMGAVFLLIIYVVGLAGSVLWATSLGATQLLGLTLWTSFYGFCTAVFLALFWGREHWLP